MVALGLVKLTNAAVQNCLDEFPGGDTLEVIVIGAAVHFL